MDPAHHLGWRKWNMPTKPLNLHQKKYGLDDKLPLVMQPRCCFCHSLPSLEFWLKKNEIGVWNATSLFAHMVTHGFGWIPARNCNLSNILGHVGKNWWTHLKDNLERFLIIGIHSSLIMPTAEASFFWYKTHIAIFLSHLYIHLIPPWVVTDGLSQSTQLLGKKSTKRAGRWEYKQEMSCAFWLVEKLFSIRRHLGRSVDFLQTWLYSFSKTASTIKCRISFVWPFGKGFECQ